MYTYDSIGRLIASCVKSGVTVLMQTRQEYNSNNQLTAQHWTVGDTTYSETYAYNKTEGTLSSMTTGNGHTISLTYDNLRRVSKVDTGTLDRYYTYRTVTGTDGTTTSQVSQLRYGGDTTSYFTYDYTYDVLGNIATYKQNGTTWTYTYDKQSQLTKATSGSTTYSYSYDNAGNITAANGKSYTYGNTVWRDLLTKYDGQYIAYEGQTVSGSTVSGNPKSGNPISYYNGTRWTFDWEEGRNLVSADSTSASVDYAYDQNGLRVSKTVDGVKHTYLYASGKLLRESYGNVVLDFFYDQSGYPYAMTYKNGTAAAVTYYYITNLQGDVLTMITGTGTSVASYIYDPYGKPLTATGTMATINPLRYRGYYYDTETGFYYLQSRYYDPAICRFINADSYASTGQGVLGNNMFAYCGNNPISHIDSTGVFPWWAIPVIIIVLLTSGCEQNDRDSGPWEYQYTDSKKNNCLGYALGLKEAVYLGGSKEAILESYSLEYVAELFVEEVESRGWSIRLLNGIDDPISDDEYRVAIATGQGDYHFMVQHSDGTWSHKPGPLASEHLGTDNPSQISWDLYVDITLRNGVKIRHRIHDYYSDGPRYYAISKGGS